MGYFLNRSTVEYIKDTSTPSDPENWIANPDLSLLLGIVDQKYWKIVVDDVVEMSVAEKAAENVTLGEKDIGSILALTTNVINTTDATWTDVVVVTLADTDENNLEWKVASVRTDVFQCSLIKMMGIYYHDSGSASSNDIQLGLVDTSNPDIDTRLTTSGDDVMLQVKGVNTENWTHTVTRAD